MIGEEFTLDDIAAAVRSGGLLSMEIEFSLRCNFRCQYCYVGQDAGAERELSPDEIRATILQAKALGARKIIVLGGEPMIYPQIMEMLAFIRSCRSNAPIFRWRTAISLERSSVSMGSGALDLISLLQKWSICRSR